MRTTGHDEGWRLGREGGKEREGGGGREGVGWREGVGGEERGGGNREERHEEPAHVKQGHIQEHPSL